MKLLLDDRKLILHIGNAIEFGVFEDEEKWKVDNMLYVIDNGYTCVEVGEVPIEVIPEKYFYIANEFVSNPNFLGRDVREIEFKKLELQVMEHSLNQAETELDVDFRLINLELGLI